MWFNTVFRSLSFILATNPCRWSTHWLQNKMALVSWYAPPTLTFFLSLLCSYQCTHKHSFPKLLHVLSCNYLWHWRCLLQLRDFRVIYRAVSLPLFCSGIGNVEMQAILLVLTRLLMRQVATEKQAGFKSRHQWFFYRLSADKYWTQRLTVLLDNWTFPSLFFDFSPSTQVTISTAHGLISVSATVWVFPASAIR
jgi:hypothetical protein